jgi:hypothetical protein
LTIPRQKWISKRQFPNIQIKQVTSYGFFLWQQQIKRQQVQQQEEANHQKNYKSKNIKHPKQGKTFLKKPIPNIQHKHENIMLKILLKTNTKNILKLLSKIMLKSDVIND